MLIPRPCKAKRTNLARVLDARNGFHKAVQPLKERTERASYVRALLLGEAYIGQCCAKLTHTHGSDLPTSAVTESDRAIESLMLTS
jgi:hypothetical protein